MAISRTDCPRHSSRCGAGSKARSPTILTLLRKQQKNSAPGTTDYQIVGTLVFLDIAFKISSEEHKASSDHRAMATSSTLG
jgi:hypothetical protein